MAQEFLIACQRGNLQQAKTWLDANPPLLEASEGNGFTGLILSSQGGHLPIVQLLLERGATFDRTTKNGNSALACASQFGHTAVVKLLLDHNASNVNGRNVGGDTALMAAAQMGHAAVVELLIAHGADPSLQNEGGLTAFMCAAGSGKFDAFRACFQADEVCDAAEKIAATTPSPSNTAAVEEAPELAPFSISPFTAASDSQSTPVLEPVLLPASCTHHEMPAALLLNDVNGRSVLHFALAACATENADLRTIRRLMRWPQTEELWTRSTGTKVLLNSFYLGTVDLVAHCACV
jgi:ankyrin repeat protein